MTQIMRNSLCDIVSGSLKNPNAGLLMQRGLSDWDNVNKTAKEKLIGRVSKISAPEFYKKAYQRWQAYTNDKERFAFTEAKIIGRLYTGLSSATALETGITTHHTYGMPMIVGSGVKGAVAAYAAQIGLLENNPDVYQVLFGDEDSAGAVVWHDAWWIPNSSSILWKPNVDNTLKISASPFVSEIVTTHHQEYYNNPQKQADGLENPIPNQQIACGGGFYFAVEAVNKAWADFAKNLLLDMLENQGIGSKTASGYGYFECNNQDTQPACGQESKPTENTDEEAALPEHERLIVKWKEKLQQQRYSLSNQEHTNSYHELKNDLENAYQNSSLTDGQKKEIATALSYKVITETYQQSHWLNKNRIKEIKLILQKLCGEQAV